MHEAVLPLRAFLFRLSIVFFILACIILMVLSQMNHKVASTIRTGIIDSIVPTLTVLSSPVESVQSISDTFNQFFFALDENEKLRAENEKLKSLQSVAIALEAENDRLRQLLNMLPKDKGSFQTARIVGDTGGAYTRSVLINLGDDGKLTEGLIVTNPKGLVGRVMDVGAHSSRVMLLTDINSRVPVVTEKSRERAVLAGNNTPYPQLNHLPDDSNLRIGERVVTSGDGELFPPGIPVGEIHRFEGGIIQVKPLVDWARLDYVTIMQRK